MTDDSSDFGAFMAGFVIGGLVGAATALILAPQSGAETRAKIVEKSEDIKHAGEEQYLVYRDKAQASINDVQARVQETSEQVEERARIVLDEGKTRLQKTQSEVETQQGEAEIDDKEEGTGDESPT